MFNENRVKSFSSAISVISIAYNKDKFSRLYLKFSRNEVNYFEKNLSRPVPKKVIIKLFELLFFYISF